MKITGIKLILLLTFSVFLVHDYLPHFHLNEHSGFHKHQMEDGEHHDEPVLAHNIDHVFVGKKHEQLPLTFKIISVAVEPIDLSADLTGSFTFRDSSEPVNPAPLIRELSPRAPPVV